MKANFQQLLKQAFDGSNEAVEKIVDEFGEAVIITVRRKLSAGMRRQFDSEDFVQGVWKSFFIHDRNCEDFRSPELLAAFLRKMAMNKVAEAFRRMEGRGKNKANGERRVVDLNLVEPEQDLIGHDTPSQYAIAYERFHDIFGDLSEADMTMVLLRAEGMSYREISEKVNRNVDSVRRIIRRVRDAMDERDDLRDAG